MYRNSIQRYGLVAQLLHWATAVPILILIPLGIFMHELPTDSAAEVTYKAWFYSLHKTLGVTALFFAVMRVGWAIIQPHPRPLNSENQLEVLAAQTVHWTLYGAIIAMPISGWLHHSALEGFAPIWWPLPQDLPFVPKNAQLAEIFGTAHFVIAILLGTALALHIAGALKHALVDRDKTLERMIPFRSIDLPADLQEAPHKSLSLILAFGAFLLAGIAVSISLMPGSQSNLTVSENSAEAGAADAGWQVDMQVSVLGIQIIQSGAPVAGRFNNWSASINFDPEKLEAANALVEIDVRSLALGAVSERALEEDFLNGENYPKAIFQAGQFVEIGEGSYEARGTLELAGVTQSVTLPFDLKISDDRAIVEGKVSLKRLDFNIGRQGFTTDSMIGFEVEVHVNLEADKM